MRETKFKGKVKYNGNHLFSGDWVEGSLIVKYVSEGVFIYVIEKDEFGNIIREFEIEVDPETVSQYTGLKDQNGAEIYEDDEVEIIVTKGVVHKGIIVFNYGSFCLKSKSDLGKDKYNVIALINYAPSCIITKLKPKKS